MNKFGKLNKFIKQSIWVTLALLMLLLLLTVKAFADHRVAQINSKLPELYKFISDHSDYTTTNVPAFKLQFKSAKQLMEIYYGPLANSSNDSLFAVQAVYSGGTMILRDDFDIDSMSHVLLHELVHHVQFMSGRAFECRQAMEWEAYDIMDKYVEHSGVGEKTDPLFKMLMTCKTDMEFR